MSLESIACIPFSSDCLTDAVNITIKSIPRKELVLLIEKANTKKKGDKFMVDRDLSIPVVKKGADEPPSVLAAASSRANCCSFTSCLYKVVLFKLCHRGPLKLNLYQPSLLPGRPDISFSKKPLKATFQDSDAGHPFLCTEDSKMLG
jgi:hypothetical protein